MRDESIHYNSKIGIGLVIGMVVLTGLGVLTWYITESPARQEVGTEAATALVDSEDTPYLRLDGTPFSFNELRGQVRVVNVWASWSPASREELVAMDELATEFADADVAFVAINRQEPKRRIEAYLQQLPPLTDDLQLIVDETDAYYKNVEGFAMPETRIYDMAGNLHTEIRGPFEITELQAVLRDLTQ